MFNIRFYTWFKDLIQEICKLFILHLFAVSIVYISYKFIWKMLKLIVIVSEIKL